ncbi:uncharacterized protein RCO7_04959 [Rhynchosporium graminicola]|uniref:Beta-glucuronidase C-terminal domain-containing protein n=1 Tax=Rhynchosporium graminicola TaxID=2792576 RepID=A0A1E1KHQ3_9HELO|nr:uncharacterized protein RCO7_04959 [Rhynchosporium commune]
MGYHFLQLWQLSLLGIANAVTFSVSATPPSNASPRLNLAPIGVSLEFFAFPAYMNDVPSTKQCLRNMQQHTGVWPPMRIGGTTGDRATYDASSSAPVTYTVSKPGDAPASLTFGPSFMSLANTYGGKVTLGLNRRLNDQKNTLAAAAKATSSMSNLEAIELGNEPNFFTASDPIAGGSAWTATREYASLVSWQSAIGSALSTTNIFSAGVYFGVSPMNNKALAAVEGSALGYVKDFSSHNYPQSQSTANLAALMSHSGIASQVAPYRSEYSAAKSAGKDYVMGETNSATQGGGGISPTFGSALWLMDYSMQLLLLGTKAIYFHQGTVGNCQYCWWGRYSMGAPYYGAYFATLALAGADQIAPLDSATTAYAGYGIYKGGKLVRILLYNSDYYASGTRTSQSFTLTGLSATSATAKRLTAPSATSRQDQGQSPTVGGQTFEDGTCEIKGTAVNEAITVAGGSATVVLKASEALLIEV